MEPTIAFLVAVVAAWLLPGISGFGSLYMLNFLFPLILRQQGNEEDEKIRRFLRGNVVYIFVFSLALGPICFWFMLGSYRDAARERLREKLNRDYEAAQAKQLQTEVEPEVETKSETKSEEKKKIVTDWTQLNIGDRFVEHRYPAVYSVMAYEYEGSRIIGVRGRLVTSTKQVQLFAGDLSSGYAPTIFKLED